MHKYTDNFLLKKMSAKATHFFSAENISIFDTNFAKIFHELTLYELIKLTML